MKDRTIVNLSFAGDRYNGASLDEDALQVVLRFQKTLRGLAKALHKKRHLEAEKSLDERLRLVVSAFEEGSTNISLEAAQIEGEFDLNRIPDELYSASALVYDAYSSVIEDKVLPAEMPIEFIPHVAKLGDDLDEGSNVSFSPPSHEPLTISHRTRSALLSWVETSYTDTIEISGEVIQADVKNRACRLIDPSSKRLVFVRFDDRDANTVTQALRQHEIKQLMVSGTGEFNSKGHLLRFKHYTSMELVDEFTEMPTQPESLSEIASRIVADIPEELWDQLPRDATTKHNEVVSHHL